MNTEALKILIIDNIELEFNQMKREVEKMIVQKKEIFPSRNNQADKDCGNWRHLLETIRQDRFSEILEYYKDIDLFVIDICLKGEDDPTGLEFGKFINENAYGDCKIIYVSNSRVFTPETLIKGKEFTLAKYDEGVLFPTALAELIKSLFNDPVNPNKNTWKTNLREFSTKGMQALVYAIDKGLTIIFYILIGYLTWFGAKNIYLDFHGYISKEEDDSGILRLVEHIFLWLLPIFIVFGFLIYYKVNIRSTFMGAYLKNLENDPGELYSTKTMNQTKILFMSSLISYILIKAIEKILVDKDLPKNPTLIATGILLLLLMVYFIVLDILNHKKH